MGFIRSFSSASLGSVVRSRYYIFLLLTIACLLVVSTRFTNVDTSDKQIFIANEATGSVDQEDVVISSDVSQINETDIFFEGDENKH